MTSQLDVTETENFMESVASEAEGFTNEPIKILIYPPKNKQFRFDEDTNKIEVDPIQTSAQENSSNLTPLIDQCCISFNSPISQSSPINNKTISRVYEGEWKIQQVLKIEKTYSESRLKQNCFLKGCKWSPDGLCLLTNSEDSMLRVIDVPEELYETPRDDLSPVLNISEGGVIYDFAWYPKMNSWDPVSCVFVSSSCDSPIHLWDAYTGQLRATYQPINQYDEVISAYSVAFSPDGTKIYSGFKKQLKVFDISQPGRESEERCLKTKGNPIFQSNIISCICINPCLPSLYALGSYDKTIGLYSEPEGSLICLLKGHAGGVTQITFSSNGHYLFSGGRKDDEILCWDIRNPGKIVFSIRRKVETQQKIQFDISPDQHYLITGTTDGQIKVFDIENPKINENILEEFLSWEGHGDCVNGVQFHPSLPVFASASGQRHLPQFNEENEEIIVNQSKIENSVKIWKYNFVS